MYAVVGCRECEAFWIVEGRPQTTGCPRCGKRHQFDRLTRFVETEDEDRARQARAALLAERSGHGEAFAELEPFETLTEEIQDDVVTDAEYLGAAGIDVDAVEAAGERAGSGRNVGGGSRQEIVRAALQELDVPTESAVVDYASERGVPADATRRLVEQLVRAGDVTEDRGRYRLL